MADTLEKGNESHVLKRVIRKLESHSLALYDTHLILSLSWVG